MSLSLAADYLLYDDPVTVTLFQKTGEGTYDAGTQVTNAYKGPVTKDDILTNPAALQKDGAVFHLWTAKLSGKVPKMSDRIALSAVNYTVKRVEQMDRDAGGIQRYRCTTTKEIA